jgi:nitrate reductase gamma subunit
MATMEKLLIVAVYAVYAAFWFRFFVHARAWWRATQRITEPVTPRVRGKACALTATDMFFFNKLFRLNPGLWFGEWVFHATLMLVLLRHLRYVLNPVPACVWWVQTPGLIAGYILPASLVYILVIRLLTNQEKYAAPANVFLLGLVLVISCIGLVMQTFFKPDIVNVKLFILGLIRLSPVAVPGSLLFVLHFSLVLLLVPFLPTHIITAPLVMMESRKREQALHLVIHEK